MEFKRWRPWDGTAATFLFGGEHVLGKGGVDIVEFVTIVVGEKGLLVNGLYAGEEVVFVAEFAKMMKVMCTALGVFTEEFPGEVGG